MLERENFSWNGNYIQFVGNHYPFISILNMLYCEWIPQCTQKVFSTDCLSTGKATSHLSDYLSCDGIIWGE